jgi:4-amino-4-deoxy-L-arabinose transferase-like glycosyltransferase
MQNFELSKNSRRWLIGALLFMLVARIVASAWIPLTDTTEARYAEIARKMLETGDWITPQHDYGVPFWAKPPLSTWLAAASMKLLGVNEFAARLPSLLFGLGILALIGMWVAPRRGRDFALATVTMLGSMVLFFVAGGAVMTDSSLAFCTTLTMISFWQALHTDHRYWGYLFFVGLGLGLLAKGPLVGVLTFLAILPWIALRRNWREVWRAIPWIRGSALMLLIGLPWYLAAEHKTPGFIAYFILGEHFGRFLNAGWSGDKYGHAHSETLGMIWVYWLASTSPWSLAALLRAVRQRHDWHGWLRDEDGLIAYLALWSFTSILFFSFAHNIIWPYALPTLPAFAILTMEFLTRAPKAAVQFDTTSAIARLLPAASLATPIVLLAMTLIYADDQQALLKSSQRDTAQFYMQTRPTPDSGLYYFRHRYYSGEFYSSGKARVASLNDIERLLHNGSTDYLVIQRDELKTLPAHELAQFRVTTQLGRFLVLKESQPASPRALGLREMPIQRPPLPKI